MQVFVLRERQFSTHIYFQVNSDSTCTCDQAQSSSSDAAAEQQRQEIESLKAEAAQVPCGQSSYCSPLCIVFLFSWLLEKLSSQTQCDPTRYSSSKKSLLKLRRRKHHTILVGLQRSERIDWIDVRNSFAGFPARLKKLRQLLLLNSNGKKLKV